jgi:hypothetical protein
MTAPCGDQPKKFLAELVKDGLCNRPIADVLAFLKTEEYLERLEFALSAYREEVHWDWTSYRAQMVRQLDCRFGETWRMTPTK